jgi:hypothetical protein|uniref:PcfJ like protein n=1 Tax=Siphoviridae sp. ct1IF5 TaxID=2827765 RepID=A0A8S5TFX3_9CAUD|nr:MAG TPA: PcfJ like protein [Siphoviridae sp. ct1IF5]DAJ72778.1 MAG TPA: PcfJ like protein [Caudoviricetes sp.]
MRVYKDKQYLIFDYEDGRTVKYDFATNTAIGIKGKPVKNLCSQLRGFYLEQLFDCCDDKQYAKFLRFIRNAESHSYLIDNIGTILDRVSKYAHFEQIFSAGLEDIITDRCHFQYSINEIPKSLIKLCKKYSIKISNEMVKYYKENQDAHYIAYTLDYFSLTLNDIYVIWSKEDSRWNNNNGEIEWYSFFNKLVNEYGYNAKDLWLYLDRIKTFEAIEDMDFLIRELYDYASLMRELSPKYDKYPKNFLTTHKIACRNYSRMKKEFSEELFRKRINKQYECSFGDYVFIYPKSTQDIKDESVQMSNCVSSYIDDVINGDCHILFLRKKNKPEESLVTIEVRNNRIVQARRRFNDDVTAEDQKAIDAFNKKFTNKEDKVA